MTLLDGFPPRSCKPMTFSYENAGRRTKRKQNTRNKVLCSKAIDKGFVQILRIDSIHKKPRLISCQKKEIK